MEAGRAWTATLAIVLVAAGLAQSADAGTIIVSRRGGAQGVTKQYYDGDRFRGAGVIVRGDRIVVFDDGARVFWAGTLEEYCAQSRRFVESMQARLPPALRARKRAKPRYTVERLGSRVIAGIRAQGFRFRQIFHGNQAIPVREVWVGDDPVLREAIRLEQRRRRMDCFKGDPLEQSKAYRRVVDGRFVLATSSSQVTGIEHGRIPERVFAVPSGYRRVRTVAGFFEAVSAANRPRGAAGTMR